MTTAQKRWTAAIVVVAWTYVAGAVLGLQANPLQWSADGRFFLVVVAPVMAVFAAAYPGWES